MKKKLIILALIVIVPFMTACGGNSNKLECTEKLVDDVFTREWTYEFDDKDILKNIYVTEIIDFSKTDDLSSIGCGDTLEECMNEANLEYEGCLGDSYYEDCKIVSKTNTGITISAKFSEKGMQSAISDLAADPSVGATKEEVEKSTISNGFTCK